LILMVPQIFDDPDKISIIVAVLEPFFGLSDRVEGGVQVSGAYTLANQVLLIGGGPNPAGIRLPLPTGVMPATTAVAGRPMRTRIRDTLQAFLIGFFSRQWGVEHSRVGYFSDPRGNHVLQPWGAGAASVDGIIYGTELLSSVPFRQQAEGCVTSLITFASMLAALSKSMGAETILFDHLKRGIYLSGSFAACRKLMAEGLTNPALLPARLGPIPRGAVHRVLELEFGGALAFLLNGAVTQDEASHGGLVQVFQHTSRQDSIPIPSLYNEYLVIEQGLARMVMAYAMANESFKPADLYRRKGEMIDVILTILGKYFTNVDSESKERLETMFMLPDEYLLRADGTSYPYPYDLMPSMISSAARPFTGYQSDTLNAEHLDVVGEEAGATARLYDLNPRQTKLSTSMLNMKHGYLEGHAYIKLERITPIIVQSLETGTFAVFTEKRAPPDIATILLSDLMKVEEATRYDISEQLTVETIMSLAAIHNATLPAANQISYIKIDGEPPTADFSKISPQEDKFMTIERFTVKRAHEIHDHEFEPVDVKLYYQHLREDVGLAGARETPNQMLRTHIFVPYEALASKLVSYEGLDIRDAAIYDELDVRVTTGAGLPLTSIITVGRREKESYEIRTSLESKNLY